MAIPQIRAKCDLSIFCLPQLLTWDPSPSAVSVRSFGYQITNPCGRNPPNMARVSVHITGYKIHHQLFVWSLLWLTISPMIFPISSLCAFMISALKKRNWNAWVVTCRHIYIVHHSRKLIPRCVARRTFVDNSFEAVLLQEDKHTFFCKWRIQPTHPILRPLIAWYCKKFTFVLSVDRFDFRVQGGHHTKPSELILARFSTISTTPHVEWTKKTN